MGTKDLFPEYSDWGASFSLFLLDGDGGWAEGGNNDIIANIRGVELTDKPSYDPYDIAALGTISAIGLFTADGKETNNITIDSYRDEVYGDADGFKIISSNTAAGCIGFEELKNPIAGYKKGDIIPKALLNTLKIIEHRDIILSDSSVNLPIPTASDSLTEMQHLNQLMSDIVSQNSHKYAQFYCPAASLCHAYEPTTKVNETLSPKFAAGKWALPTAGDLCRITWYRLQGYELDTVDAIFARAVQDKAMTPFHERNYYWSSSKQYKRYMYSFEPNKGILEYSLWYNTFAVRPIVSF